MFNFTIVLNLV